MSYVSRKTACAHEAAFAYSQSFEFRAQARRARLAGLWAAARLGIQDADRYAHDLVDASLEDRSKGDIATKLRHEFDAAGVAVSNDELQATMSAMLAEAFQELKAA